MSEYADIRIRKLSLCSFRNYLNSSIVSLFFSENDLIVVPAQDNNLDLNESTEDSYMYKTTVLRAKERFDAMGYGIDKFEKEGYQKYDEFLLRAILKRIADSQIGLMVKLSDESIWEIFVINPAALSRPILKRNNNEFLDLSTRPDLQISSIH